MENFRKTFFLSYEIFFEVLLFIKLFLKKHTSKKFLLHTKKERKIIF